MQPEPCAETMPAREPAEGSYALAFCIGCCPPSERWWFRWVLAAQPVIALVLYLYHHVGWD
jgi:hypothetical protein